MIIGGDNSDEKYVYFIFLCISNDWTIFSSVETEIWEFNYGNKKVVDPTLPADDFAYGIGLYIVPFDFCTN